MAAWRSDTLPCRQWLPLAELQRGRCPIVVGGTGFYLRWLLRGKPATGKVSPETEARVKAAMEQVWGHGGLRQGSGLRQPCSTRGAGESRGRGKGEGSCLAGD